jgi:hypothetical protein
MSDLKEYPFLAVALEDMRLASALAGPKSASPRHVVLLLHDALEFLLYEILLALDQDIYKNGQTTIGLDAAISACKTIGVHLPLIGTIRSIQKFRGDAKHHAQVPQKEPMDRIIAQFRVIVSRLVHEHFGQALAPEVLATVGLLPYHTALYESYRKYRTHNWGQASRLAIGALLHKHRSMMKLEDDFSGGALEVPALVAILGVEIDPSNLPPAPQAIVEKFSAIPGTLQQLLSKSNDRAAAEYAGGVYSEIDGVLPGIFDIAKAKMLTAYLVQPQRSRFIGAWSKWSSGDGTEKQKAGEELASLLRTHPEFVEKLGPPYYAQDDDNSWRWWEFAVFDGVRWHTFHLDTSFAMLLESGSLSEDDSVRRREVAKLVLKEFRVAADTP